MATPMKTLPSSVEALAKSGPGLEVWWDSSPLIFPIWAKETLAKVADDGKRAELAAQIEAMYDPADPGMGSIVGITTNPPLSLQAIQRDPAMWDPWIDEQVRQNPSISKHDLFWTTYQEVVARGAKLFQPIFKKSGYKLGYLSGQVDPRLLKDTDEMVRQGVAMNSANRNVMVKMPGTKEGIDGIRRLTAMGIPTNATLTFVLPQLVGVAQAVMAGLSEAKAKGVDLSMWRSVCTMMLGRFEDAKPMKQQAAQLGIELTESDLRWAGVAVFKKAYRIYKERGYQSKMLAASMRPGPNEGGKTRVRHVEALAGGNVVLTIFPNIFEAWLFGYQAGEVTSHIDKDVPAEVLEKLLKIPYFAQGYDEHGIAPENYTSHAAVVETATSFAQATEDLETYCAKRIAAVTGS
jgi:transaldolase